METRFQLLRKTKYLGITFNAKLNWGTHVKYRLAGANRKIFKYKGTMKSNWGPPQMSMRWLYSCVVRPGITYGCLVWGRSVMNKYQAELRRIQGLALMLQGLFRQNTPRRALELLSAVEPLHLFIHNQILKFAYRNTHHIENLLAKYPHISDFSTINYVVRELKSLGILLNPTLLDRQPKIRVHERSFFLNKNALSIRWPKIDISNVIIFTDGSLL